MVLHFSAAIVGAEIHCLITSDVALAAPTWCFSLMAAPRVVAGGQLTRRVAGYAEVALPDLRPGQPHRVIVAHEDSAYRPRNRAWLPLGGYLRLADGQCRPLPPLAEGVAPAPRRPAPAWAGLRLVPQPDRWEPSPGLCPAQAFDAAGEVFETVAALAARLALPGFLAQGGTPVRLSIDAGLPAESYRITIVPGTIALVAADRAGALYGAITLLTLRQTHDGALPCGTITDRPRFGWRGQHLDCARHFFRVETILRLLDLMALLKLNRFHWHFADDEAFRLEVDCAPDLWQGTAFRGEGCAVPGVFGGGVRAGGSYSKADVARILAHADALNIAVMPEIEVPAHSYGLIAIRPALRDPGQNGAAVSIQGYPGNTVNPALPATWDLLEPLAAEVAGLFPFGLIHLGCDELAPAAWEGSPAVHALMQANGLAGRDDVQGWMMARLAGGLVDQGYRVAAWEEAARGANGGIGHDALLFSWTGQGPGVAAARAGYDVVMCPAQNVYLDMAHSADPSDWGATWAATTSLEDTVSWQVVPEGAEDIAPRIRGVQGTYWAEFTTDDRQIEPMLAPRLLGVAAKAWECAEATDGPALRALAAHYGPLFDRIGWRWHPGA